MFLESYLKDEFCHCGKANMLKSYCFLFNKTEQEIISHQDHDGICENKTVIYKEI